MRRLWVKQSSSDREAWKDLLEKEGIKPAKNIDRVYGIEEGGQLVATGSIDQNILKCIAIDQAWKGGPVFNDLISSLLNTVYADGYDRVFIYTKPEAAQGFSYLGFHEIERVAGKLVFMEKASQGFPAFIDHLKEVALPYQKTENGAIIMNANPMHKGHLYLIQQALDRVDQLFLFVVSDDRSYIPASLRKEIVSQVLEEELTDPSRVTILSTSYYQVSSQTFPSYFLKEDDDVSRVQALLDAKIFKNQIGPALNISLRLVGDEPFSPTTATYNQAMEEVFQEEGDSPAIGFQVIPRMEAGGRAVSASQVREALKKDDWETVQSLVPPASYRLLKDYFD